MRRSRTSLSFLMTERVRESADFGLAPMGPCGVIRRCFSGTPLLPPLSSRLGSPGEVESSACVVFTIDAQGVDKIHGLSPGRQRQLPRVHSRHRRALPQPSRLPCPLGSLPCVGAGLRLRSSRAPQPTSLSLSRRPPSGRPPRARPLTASTWRCRCRPGGLRTRQAQLLSWGARNPVLGPWVGHRGSWAAPRCLIRPEPWGRDSALALGVSGAPASRPPFHVLQEDDFRPLHSKSCLGSSIQP
ncbi:uncharacterized protein LOC125613708 isoform X1 [Marmota marmota marmota]|uniref:uncharacterized protein LOC125613708 isoform X1 n=1 Tax=Marmota marmota marmota TaxID=9994 RepID=UPI00209231D0|nr:uncharacterized protein LOC125613708 isoform X1 [Marmota marmota marmota]